MELASERGKPKPRWLYFSCEHFFSVTAELFVAEPRACAHDLVWENRTSAVNQVQDEAGKVDTRDRARNSKIILSHRNWERQGSLLELSQGAEPGPHLEFGICPLELWEELYFVLYMADL